MTNQDWTIRNKDGVAIIRVEGQDYAEVPGSTEHFPAAYPDSVRNTVLEHGDDGLIKVVLGEVRYVLNEENEIDENKGTPQTVWLAPINETDELEAASEEETKTEGFVTG